MPFSYSFLIITPPKMSIKYCELLWLFLFSDNTPDKNLNGGNISQTNEHLKRIITIFLSDVLLYKRIPLSAAFLIDSNDIIGICVSKITPNDFLRALWIKAKVRGSPPSPT